MEKKKLWAAGILLLLACLLAGALYLRFKPEPETGDKHVTVTVVHGDGSEKEFSYDTDAGYLGEVLEENGLISGEEGQFGLFITEVDGETADEGKEQWWCITKGGEMVNTSVDTTPIEDGDEFELTLKEGY